MNSLILTAPAKINLRLEITGRRPDGYHEIATVFQKISLSDEVTIRTEPTPGIRFTTDDATIPDDASNLVCRAAALLLENQPCPGGISIHLKKRIPAGAGLGGGSSDAAATLLGIQRLYQLSLQPGRLEALALQLGADVPFFLQPAPTAYATGIGERLTPVRLNTRLWCIVIFPGLPVSTAWAYKTFSTYNQLTKLKKKSIVNDSIKDAHDVVGMLQNDFETVVLPAHPEIQTAKDDLLRTGAMGALLSGSGSAVFGLYSDKAACEQALRALPEPPGRSAFIVHSQ